MTDEIALSGGDQTASTDFEKVKLFKNTKGFNWEIVLLADKRKAEKAEDLLLRLKKINNDLDKEYGSGAISST